MREQRGDHLRVGGRVEPDAGREELVPERRRVDEVAVVPERDGARRAVVHDRLGVRPVRATRRRVARVPDRDLAGERRELLLVEDLRHEAHLAQHRDAPALGDGDPGGLLAAMLEREEPEVRQAGDVALAGADAEDAAHQALTASWASASSVSGSPRSASPPTVPIRRTSTPPPVGSSSTCSGGSGHDDLTADLAEERQRILVELELRADPAPERRLGERDGKPALGDVVDERRVPAGARRVADERDLGREVERRQAAERAPARLRLGARRGERRPRACEEDRVARPASRAGRGGHRATSPTQPTTGVGWIERPSVSL